MPEPSCRRKQSAERARHRDLGLAESPRQRAYLTLMPRAGCTRGYVFAWCILCAPPASASRAVAVKLTANHLFDQPANPVTDPGLDRIKPIVEKMGVTFTSAAKVRLTVTLVMAWSPARRSNAGRFEVEHPGDYAAFNSYQPGYGTRERRFSTLSAASI